MYPKRVSLPLVVVAAMCALLVGSIGSDARALAESDVEYLGDSLNRLVIDHHQQWGKLGVNTAAGAPAGCVAIDAAVGDIIITGLRPAVQDIMEITGFLEFFRTATSREEGLKALG